VLQFIGCAFLIGVFAGFLFILIKLGVAAAIIFLAVLMALGIFSKGKR